MKVLLGVDFSSDSKAAIRLLSSIGFPPSSDLSLIHVISGYDALRVSHSYELEENLRALQEEARDRAYKNLNRLAVKFIDPCLTFHSEIKDGNVGKAILSFLEQKRIDLAVLGTRGMSGLQRFLLGSVSEWILQEAPCSVLIVRGARRLTNRGIRVLLTTDGSLDAQRALEFLNRLRLPAQSEVTVFHAVEGSDYRVVQDDFRSLIVDSSGHADLVKLSQDIQTRREVAGRALVKDVKRGLANRYSKGEHLSTGHAAEEILHAARRFRADLIVMGSRGLTGIKRQFLGSVSTRVAYHAPCSVLVVRELSKKKVVRLQQ